MNERIKALREQSIKWAYENQQSMDGALDKFAELIIKECADYAEYQLQIGGTNADKIKQHFGVK